MELLELEALQLGSYDNVQGAPDLVHEDQEHDGIQVLQNPASSRPAPIHLLPPEILGYIFELVCEGNPIHLRFPRHRELPVAAELAQVCRNWRATASQFSRLWKTLILEFDPDETKLGMLEEQMSKTATILHEIVPRPKTIPLDLRLVSSNTWLESVNEATTAAIGESWKRILQVFVDQETPLEEIHLLFRYSVRGLEVFAPLNVSELVVDEVIYLAEELTALARVWRKPQPARWPVLRKLSLSNVYITALACRIVQDIGMLSMLTELTLFFTTLGGADVGGLIRLLSHIPQLLTLRCNWGLGTLWKNFSDPDAERSIVLPNLKTLEMTDIFLSFPFHRLEVPALETLDVVSARGQTQALRSFMTSLSNLTRLRVCYVPYNFFEQAPGYECTCFGLIDVPTSKLNSMAGEVAFPMTKGQVNENRARLLAHFQDERSMWSPVPRMPELHEATIDRVQKAQKGGKLEKSEFWKARITRSDMAFVKSLLEVVGDGEVRGVRSFFIVFET